jgi:hypothetical protein
MVHFSFPFLTIYCKVIFIVLVYLLPTVLPVSNFGAGLGKQHNLSVAEPPGTRQSITTMEYMQTYIICFYTLSEVLQHLFGIYI